MNRKTIAFIGGGNMGEAIISKMVSSDWKGDDIHVIDHNEEKLERLSSEYGVHAHKEPGSWLSEIDAVAVSYTHLDVYKRQTQCSSTDHQD